MGILRIVPTACTLSRFLLGPAFIWAYGRAAPAWALLLIVAAAIVTDWLDGFLARRWNVTSTVGKLLDPFADALFCMIVFFVVWRSYPDVLPAWLLALLVAREALVTFVLRPLALFNRVVIAASVPGKMKTVTQFAVICLFIGMQTEIAREAQWLATVVRVGFYIVAALSLFSAAIYIRRTIAALRAPEPGAECSDANRAGGEKRSESS